MISEHAAVSAVSVRQQSSGGVECAFLRSAETLGHAAPERPEWAEGDRQRETERQAANHARGTLARPRMRVACQTSYDSSMPAPYLDK